jgi:hypothetical protein
MEYSAHFFYIKNDAKILPAHYTQKVAEKGDNLMVFMIYKLKMIKSYKIILEK